MIQQLHSWAFIPDKQKVIVTRNLCMNVHSSFICNCPKPKTIQMFFKGWMAKILLSTKVLLSIKKKLSIDTCNTMNGSHRNFLKGNLKMSYTVWFRLYNVFEKMTFSRDGKQIFVCQELGRAQGGKGYGYKRVARGILVTDLCWSWLQW